MAWHVVGRLGDLPESALVPALAGRARVVLIRRGDAVLAISARCPHQGADLSEGLLTGFVDAPSPGCLTLDRTRMVLRCPWHGFEYDVATGEPLAASPEHRRLRLRHHAVEIDGEDVRVDA